MNNPLILASSSPRRKDMLEKINLRFEVIPSIVTEDYSIDLTASKMAEYWAIQKARNVASSHEKNLVIGVDTIVELEKTIMGKPANSSEAQEMLKALSGKHHIVYTGIALICASLDTEESFVESTDVYFNKLNDDWIDQYVSTGMPLDKAGGYGIQDWSSFFVDRISGCYNNVVGFPLARFIQVICSNNILEQFLLDNWFASEK